MGSKHQHSDEDCMQSLLLSITHTDDPTTNTTPASSSESKRQNMGIGSTRRRAAVAVPEIHVVPGPLVNSYGNLAEGLLGTSVYSRLDQQPEQQY